MNVSKSLTMPVLAVAGLSMFMASTALAQQAAPATGAAASAQAGSTLVTQPVVTMPGFAGQYGGFIGQQQVRTGVQPAAAQVRPVAPVQQPVNLQAGAQRQIIVGPAQAAPQMQYQQYYVQPRVQYQVQAPVQQRYVIQPQAVTTQVVQPQPVLQQRVIAAPQVQTRVVAAPAPQPQIIQQPVQQAAAWRSVYWQAPPSYSYNIIRTVPGSSDYTPAQASVMSNDTCRQACEEACTANPSYFQHCYASCTDLSSLYNGNPVQEKQWNQTIAPVWSQYYYNSVIRPGNNYQVAQPAPAAQLSASGN